jgi:hypothetical protein
MKIKTYSECKFLDEIFSNVPKNTFSELLLASNNEITKWNYLFELIYQKSELSLLDCKKEDLVLKARANPFYQKLINQFLTGSIRLNFSSNLKPEKNDWKLVPFGSVHCYFTNILNKPGNLFICNLDNWKDEIGSISSAISYQVSSDGRNNTFPGWEFLKIVNLPCDAAIIFDRYILKKPSDLENNLFAILSNVIPDNLQNIINLYENGNLRYTDLHYNNKFSYFGLFSWLSIFEGLEFNKNNKDNKFWKNNLIPTIDEYKKMIDESVEKSTSHYHFLKSL